ncbi:MAG: CBS domain-containing protein [Peptococcaceae bacterium]|nr:MAG: CBS domain-containing protein [Peptococcaceae bacterium]
MPSDRRVKEIMVPLNDYSTVLIDAPLKEAIDVLNDSLHQYERIWYGYHSLLVINPQKELVGMLTLRTILKAAMLLELKQHQQLRGSSWGWYFAAQHQKKTGIRVKDVMRPLKLVTARAEDTVFTAAVKMVTHRINSLPVLDKNHVVGIVRTFDVFQVIGELLAGGDS